MSWTPLYHLTPRNSVNNVQNFQPYSVWACVPPIRQVMGKSHHKSDIYVCQKCYERLSCDFPVQFYKQGVLNDLSYLLREFFLPWSKVTVTVSTTKTHSRFQIMWDLSMRMHLRFRTEITPFTNSTTIHFGLVSCCHRVFHLRCCRDKSIQCCGWINACLSSWRIKFWSSTVFGRKSCVSTSCVKSCYVRLIRT